MRTLLLCYHNVVPQMRPAAELEALLAVPAERLALHLRHLSATHVPGPLPDGGETDGQKRLVVTFDDGYRGLLTSALPILKQWRVPAYVFVNPAFVGGWNPRDQVLGLVLWGPPDAAHELGDLLRVYSSERRERLFAILRAAMWRALRRRGEGVLADLDGIFSRYADDRLRAMMDPVRLLTWDELRALRSEGMQIGNHTLRHLELEGLPRPLIRSEIRDAQLALVDRLGAEAPVISYPRNKVDRATLEETAAAGYTWGLTTVPGVLTGSTPTLHAPRIAVSPGDGVPTVMWKTSALRLWARTLGPAVHLRRLRQQQSRRPRWEAVGK